MKILIENAQTFLYHVTDIDQFIEIAKSNVLKATSYTDGNKFVDGIPKVRACFTRKPAHMGGDVKFVVNKDKLSTQYKITPFNMFQTYRRKSGNISKLYRSQYEEFVDRDITNFIRYVDKIYVEDYYDASYLIDAKVPTNYMDKVIFVPDINGVDCR